MRNIAFAAFCIWILITFGATCIASDEFSIYHEMKLEGWTVFVEQNLVDNNDPRVYPALKILSERLQEAKRLIPAHHLGQLQKVPIWLSENTGDLAEYYLFQENVYRYERNPKKVGGIEFQNIDLFLLAKDEYPMLVIHELAHAYHKLNYERLDLSIMKAFENARWEKLYEDLRLGRSLHTEDMYASTSPFEYFAELSSAYFGYNDEFPHDAEELEKHDPVGYKMVKNAWEN